MANRRRGRNEADNERRELLFKEDCQEYGQVLSKRSEQKSCHTQFKILRPPLPYGELPDCIKLDDEDDDSDNQVVFADEDIDTICYLVPYAAGKRKNESTFRCLMSVVDRPLAAEYKGSLIYNHLPVLSKGDTPQAENRANPTWLQN
ncbi:hypothetical protein Tco_0084764 [Tanacetum coccineum]